MSLYYDATTVLSSPTAGGSLKSRIYNSSLKLKSSPPQIYALIIESSKWDVVIADVIEKAGLLSMEHKLTPLLATLLVHDHLFSKGGIAAPASHPLRQAVERHKARLKAELTKARIRKGCATLPELKAKLEKEKNEALYPDGIVPPQPRWVRVNEIVTSIEKQMSTTFAGYEVVGSLQELGTDRAVKKRIFIDPHVDALVALPGHVDMTATPAYKNGEIILQDKASCFPAQILLGKERHAWRGDIIDGCAAPGNKTTHLAALVSKQPGSSRSKIFACDASKMRSKTLQMMVSKARADKTVTVLQGQDFLKMDPTDEKNENVTALLLDPSCSGSGIVNREDVPVLNLPTAAAGKDKAAPTSSKSKKRKREEAPQSPAIPEDISELEDADSADPLAEETPMAPTSDIKTRLEKLSNLQYLIVAHALTFPRATRISYSTCSIHDQENEHVVSRILSSDVAKQRGWRLLKREEQVDGMKKWEWRGREIPADSVPGDTDGLSLSKEDAEACVRSFAGNMEGTGGFFVAVFVRDETAEDELERGTQSNGGKKKKQKKDKKAGRAKEKSDSRPTLRSDSNGVLNGGEAVEDEFEEWGGFDD